MQGKNTSNELGSYLKDGFWYKVKAAGNIKPEEYIGYFEDLI